MELKMEVYGPELELLGIMETYSSLLVSDWAFQSGDFTLTAPLRAETKALLVPENIVWFYGETAGIIESYTTSANADGVQITVRGSLLSGILRRRILWGLYDLYDDPAKIMRDVVTDCAVSPTRGDVEQRKIPNLIIDNPGQEDAKKVRKQSTGDNLSDFLSELGQSQNVAYGIRFDPTVPSMAFWSRHGVNRSIDQELVDPVFYSTELDDVLSSEYSYDSSEYTNVALVAGEGEGTARKVATVTKPNESVISGISRREMYVDARDLQSESNAEEPMPEEEYLEVLTTRGTEKLSDSQLVQSFSATVRSLNPTYEFEKDFFLGDTITVKDERVGVMANAVVEGVERSFSRDGEDMVLTFGYSAPTLGEKLRKVGR